MDAWAESAESTQRKQMETYTYLEAGDKEKNRVIHSGLEA